MASALRAFPALDAALVELVVLAAVDEHGPHDAPSEGTTLVGRFRACGDHRCSRLAALVAAARAELEGVARG